MGSNLVVAIVGDVKFADVKKYAKKYFSAIPAGNPEPVETFEPKQLGEKRFVMKDPSQPIFIAGYHIQNVRHPDWPVYEVIADVLGQGRTSRFYEKLVKQDKIAVQAMAFPGLPGREVPDGSAPASGSRSRTRPAPTWKQAIYAEIDKVVADGITAEELAAVKQRTRADFIRGLRGNGGMAEQLA